MSQKPSFDPSMHANSDGGDAIARPRRPKPETQARLMREGPASAMPPATKNSSGLSVDAPEFKPKNSYQGNHGPPVAQPGLSVSAAEFVPRTDFVTVPSNMVANVGPLVQMPPPGPPAAQDSFVNSFNQLNLEGGGECGEGDQEEAALLDSFYNTMMILNSHPGNIRDFLAPLCNRLRQARTPSVMASVIDILYEQSIYEPNFRYTGARVCHFLCNELKGHDIFGQFTTEVVNKCGSDFLKREEMLEEGEEGLIRLCGLTLFMGELYLNVTVDKDGHTERLNFLPSALTDLVQTLLSRPSDTTIKTACQLLKLTGGCIEDDMKTNPVDVQNFNSIFSLLQSLDSTPHISQNMKLLMKSVVTLRQNNWGRSDSATSSPGDSNPVSTAPPPDFSQSEPVFYNIYGKPITREEAGYQEEQEEEEEACEDYELTEEEERDFLIWQEEASSHGGMAPPISTGNTRAQPAYPDGSMYQQWSTGDNSYSYQNYPPGYYSNMYAPYGEEEGLNDEMMEAFEEYLSSHGGPPMGKK